MLPVFEGFLNFIFLFASLGWWWWFWEERENIRGKKEVSWCVGVAFWVSYERKNIVEMVYMGDEICRGNV